MNLAITKCEQTGLAGILVWTSGRFVGEAGFWAVEEVFSSVLDMKYLDIY